MINIFNIFKKRNLKKLILKTREDFKRTKIYMATAMDLNYYDSDDNDQNYFPEVDCLEKNYNRILAKYTHNYGEVKNSINDVHVFLSTSLKVIYKKKEIIDNNKIDKIEKKEELQKLDDESRYILSQVVQRQKTLLQDDYIECSENN